ncbi:MAG: GntG family PLP-dependent aldolase, partial [Bacteroidota bacterium]
MDLRSDTLTQPTEAMKEAMFQAQVGDDVYGEDPSINELQAYTADLFGKEDALFCASGTMCNQIAIRVSTQPQDEVICDQRAHIYLYEGGGLMANSFVSVRLLEGDRSRLHAAQIEENINPDDVHFPRTSLVALENTANKGGGSIYTLSQIDAIQAVCDQHGLRLHLDGARVMNACVAGGYRPRDMGARFDTISICLSKGLGAPVGSVLVGDKATIKQAKRVRKMLGGGMRQAGFLAAAGLYALQHHVERLEEDHIRAKRLGEFLENAGWVEDLMPVETNIVAFKPNPDAISTQALQTYLTSQGVYVSTFGPGYLRMVTHLHITDEMIQQVIQILEKAPV